MRRLASRVGLQLNSQSACNKAQANFLFVKPEKPLWDGRFAGKPVQPRLRKQEVYILNSGACDHRQLEAPRCQQRFMGMLKISLPGWFRIPAAQPFCDRLQAIGQAKAHWRHRDIRPSSCEAAMCEKSDRF